MGINDGEIRYQYIDSDSQCYNPEVYKVPNFTNISGFFQTERYFEGYEDLIKKWYKIEIDEDTQKVLDNYPVNEYCYIHIRGSINKNSYIMLPKSYYENGIKEVKKINPDLKFVIITDDYEISKQYFPELDVLSSNAFVDFKSLYYSKYAIISNSTFSWWGAYLQPNRRLTLPSQWTTSTDSSRFNFGCTVITFEQSPDPQNLGAQ
jgi:hypothetical protein